MDETDEDVRLLLKWFESLNGRQSYKQSGKRMQVLKVFEVKMFSRFSIKKNMMHLVIVNHLRTLESA